MKTVTCLNHFLDQECGWVSFEVSREYAESEVKSFNEYFAKLDTEKQEAYYGGHGANIEFYEQCFRCGGSYKNFKDSDPEEVPNGSTLNPVINRKE